MSSADQGRGWKEWIQQASSKLTFCRRRCGRNGPAEESKGLDGRDERRSRTAVGFEELRV
ncbi:hypothetical protein EYF80_054492 [Liparis tanakae]|uniref:Uncharacterized protein n=1 Tax=Liparis tanakae TaxID=230148 RepID=A0A4Z2F2I4_9TELE|nr:hypothetical protein EYF80_054492 [Liparis tanakae]